ncbi:hypothetical protein CGCFRS4_v012101 [Colletotrichum fructicola]|uniref:Heterokaryon incompatibility domain-containing protein n=1 Tax=Colletotrichum fructicola (strain Nara gc5) TaxID=1213859 RepID=L2G504_COLFN|nr:hypothetical protein CGCFRS4_v012101 [Colletotrichum fructicola]
MTLSLGFEYLWVDAYCIIQDSDNDMSIELAKMAAIYSAAVCTISVVSAATAGEGWMSPRSNNGLLSPPLEDSEVTRLFLYRADSEQLLTPECLILEISEAFAQKTDPEPLHTRGWTLQESLLSPRLLSVSSAYRGRSTLRCAKRIARADGGFVHRTSQLAAWPVNDQDGDEKTKYIDKPGWAVKRWYDVLSEYSKNRHLTTKSDKLTALAGIAAEFIRLQNLGVYDVGVYVAGLWSKSLGVDLLWKPDIDCQERGDCHPIDDIYVGPSWSWVSRDHAVSFRKSTYAWGAQSKISYRVVPKDLRNPNGALQYAELTIVCGAAEWPAACVPKSEIDDRPYTHDRNGTVWYLDLATVEPYNTPHFVGIVVQQVDRKQENKKNPAVDLFGPTLYRRVGMFESGRAAYKQDRPEKKFIII